MNSSFDFDDRLSAWLDDQAVSGAPDDLLGRVAERASQTRRRPAWATLERWISMETRAQLGAVPRTAIILVVLAVLLAVAGAVTVGQQQGVKLPPPLGPATNGLIAYDSNGDIWVTNLDGSARKQLTTGVDVDQSPIFSPDGSKIAFWNKADSNGQTALVVMDPDGGHRQTLAAGLTLSMGVGGPREASWAHDSRRLAYSDKLVNGLTSVTRITVVSTDAGVPVEIVRTGEGPTWSPDDKTIAYRGGGLDGTGGSTPLGLHLVDSTGGQPQALVTSSGSDDAYSFIYPQWSPDGTRMAYYARGHDVYVTAVQDPDPLAIAHEVADEYWPVWSPDGSRIVFDRVVAANNLVHFVVVGPDGSDPTELDHPPLFGGWATWSPDGDWLLGYLSDGNGMLVLDPSGVAQPITLSAPGEVGYSSWQRLAP